MNACPTTERACVASARVVRNTTLCREHVALEFVLPIFPNSQPGQFLQLRCTDEAWPSESELTWPSGSFPKPIGPDWRAASPYLRRPFSIADHWTDADGQHRLVIIARAIGPGTQWLGRLRTGDALDVTGPLGHGFDLPPPAAAAVLVGGGVGIPPLLYLARRLHERGHRDVTAIFGARRADSLPLCLTGEPTRDGTACDCVELPGGARYPAIITTDDGSLGIAGFVTDALVAWCQARRAHDTARITACACGPEGMLRAVAQTTRRLGLNCQLCIERTMGCGLGTCLSCVVRMRDASRPAGWHWALACTDGPVFARDVLLDFSDATRA